MLVRSFVPSKNQKGFNLKKNRTKVEQCQKKHQREPFGFSVLLTKCGPKRFLLTKCGPKRFLLTKCGPCIVCRIFIITSSAMFTYP